MIRVNLQGAQAAARRLNAAPELIRRAIAVTAQEAHDKHVEPAIQPRRKTGALEESLFLRRNNELEYEIGHDLNRAPHALFVHWGTRPHVIRPRKRKSLRWVGPGGFVFAKQVNHPGFEGDAYLVRAAREVPAIFDKHIRALMGRL